jgi:H+/K+-exchanging ATPase alpha polypeptide
MMESRNIVYCSSMIEQGTGEGLVIATGDRTVIGRMSKLTQGSGADEITGKLTFFNSP